MIKALMTGAELESGRVASRTSRQSPKELIRNPKSLGLRFRLPELCIGALIFNDGKHARIQVVK